MDEGYLFAFDTFGICSGGESSEYGRGHRGVDRLVQYETVRRYPDVRWDPREDEEPDVPPSTVATTKDSENDVPTAVRVVVPPLPHATLQPPSPQPRARSLNLYHAHLYIDPPLPTPLPRDTA